MHISDMVEISVVPPHRAPPCRKCAWWTGGTHWGWSLTDPFFLKFHKVRHLTKQHARDKVSARLFDGLKSNTFYAFCTLSVTQLRLSSGKRTSLGSLSLETFIIHHESLQVGSERQKHVQIDCRALLLASICYGFLSIASLLDSYMRFQHRIPQTSVEIPANSSNIKHWDSDWRRHQAFSLASRSSRESLFHMSHHQAAVRPQELRPENFPRFFVLGHLKVHWFECDIYIQKRKHKGNIKETMYKTFDIANYKYTSIKFNQMNIIFILYQQILKHRNYRKNYYSYFYVLFTLLNTYRHLDSLSVILHSLHQSNKPVSPRAPDHVKEWTTIMTSCKARIVLQCGGSCPVSGIRLCYGCCHLWHRLTVDHWPDMSDCPTLFHVGETCKSFKLIAFTEEMKSTTQSHW